MHIRHGFAGHPAKVWEFYFWQADSNGSGNSFSHADAGGPYQGSPGQVVGFDGSGSIIINGSLVNCTWDFGDGIYGYDIMANHIYPDESVYTAEFTITDDYGNIYSDNTMVTIDIQGGNSGNGNSCFLAGTQITMADGSYKNIEDVAEGDLVLVYDLATGELANSTVIKEYNHKQDEMPGYYLVINDDICVTPNHLLYINGTLMQAENARENDTLLKADGSNITINSIYQEVEYVPTYNIGLESTTYMYIADGIAAHHLKTSSIAVALSTPSNNNNKLLVSFLDRVSYYLPFPFFSDFRTVQYG